MKKTIHLLLVPAFLICTGARAQKKLPVYRFPCQEQQNSLNQQQVRLADSLYRSLREGEKVRLDLLSETEEKLEPTRRSQLSYQRASLLLEHYRKAHLPEREYHAEIVPFSMPNVVRTHDLTRASSVSVARKSQTYIVLTKNSSRTSDKAAVKFDADFSRELQQFDFDPCQGIDAVLTSGTRIYIPAHGLQLPNGVSPGCNRVTLRVSEYLDLEAMALKAMSTTSSGKKLQTAGMWHIDVLYNGQPLAMKPGVKYKINVNMEGEARNMRVFTGHIKNGLLDWKEQTDDQVTLPGTNTSPVNSGNLLVEEETDNERNVQLDKIYNGKIMEYNQAIFDNGNQYGLQLNDFGWINCDAFDETQQLTDITVYGEIDNNTNVMLVYGKRKSVLPGYLCEDGKSVRFSRVAADETAMLVVFRKTDDKGNVAKYTRILQPGKDTSVGVDLVASTAENLRMEIKSRLSDL